MLLPDVVDFLSLCVNAGLDLQGAITRVVAEFDPREPLIQELNMVLYEINMGRARFEALRAMADRVKIPELSILVRLIIQAEKMGTSLQEVMTIHARLMRDKRFTLMERIALKAPIKMLLPLIIIMFVVLCIVGGPIFLQFMRQSPLSGVL